MDQYLKQSASVLCAALIAAFAIQGLRAQEVEPLASRPQLTGNDAPAGSADLTQNAAAPKGQGDGSLLHVQGDATAVHLDVHRTTITQVLSALIASFDISYNSSIALDKVLDGTYTGSLPHVISRVLDGYSYVMKHERSKLTVIILEKNGEHAVAAPRQHPVSEHRALLARAASHPADN